MKRFQIRITLFLLFVLIMTVACQPDATSQQAPVATADSSESEAEQSAQPVMDLPLLPSIQSDSGYGLGEPLPGGSEDPFTAASFTLNATLPTEITTAVVQQHSFSQMDEAQARAVANQFGFTGPLYIQQIAPEFAPPAGEAASTVYTVFDGLRLMTISDTGVSYENRGIMMDFNDLPTFAEAAPAVEAQLKAWSLLDFPYELRESPFGDVLIYRLIDGKAVEQSELYFAVNKAGEMAYFSYQPGRQIDVWGNYPLQTAESAWQQLQSAAGRQGFRYQLQNLPSRDEVAQPLVNPRSWAPMVEAGQEVHLYMTPSVYEASDDSGLHLVFGDYTLAGDESDLAEIATHLSDVLHVWGTVEMVNGAKIFNITDWEKIDMVQYETVEGTLVQEDGLSLVHTADNETFILSAAPELPQGVEVYVSAAARRDIGAAYPVLDWNSITEKVEWPEVIVEPMNEEAAVIHNVNIDAVELIYFALHQPLAEPQTGETVLLLPTWKFSGTTDQGQMASFWVSAVAPGYLQSASVQPTASSGSINGWLWHDLCATAMDGEPALTSAPAGCIEALSPLGDYRADGLKDAMESAISDVVVRLGAGACPATGLAESTTITTDLAYSFTGLEAGTYCVSINPSEEPNLTLLRPGIWTYPTVSEDTVGTTVTLAEGENVFDINFGWDHQFLP